MLMMKCFIFVFCPIKKDSQFGHSILFLLAMFQNQHSVEKN